MPHANKPATSLTYAIIVDLALKRVLFSAKFVHRGIISVLKKIDHIGIVVAHLVNNIESTVDTLKMKGITFFSDIKVYNGSKKLCYFWGIEGIILELAEYFKDRGILICLTF
ncbi:hypothetical protein KDA_52840 [Dictyobacter alpinus]|uniref:VOC domain-containing protein n=1 Tax=Dictyobacter alpinus TaxID=2014873 RepID=A0A402BES4_9CHLR|nr:hypothetical protein [Dictyobacter alpinus]GCE29800.1 hypothetical protein KDA_52840 [Dictyobacter alpinus]